MSIGESAERKENDTEPTPKNGTEAKKLCSACEKESDTLKMCNGCQCVWYCDKKCQNKHRKEHKKECRLIKKELDKRGGKLDLGTEEDIGPLGKLTPLEECPICMQALPIHTMLQTYHACCGKSLCSGCTYQHKIKSGDQVTCVFCRTAAPRSKEEYLVHLRKRVELKDPDALQNMAIYYGYGDLGLPVNQTKCVELLRESASLGNPSAAYNLANYYHLGGMGLEQNEESALKYWEEAAEGGHMIARYDLGITEGRNDNDAAAMPHWRFCIRGVQEVHGSPN